MSRGKDRNELSSFKCKICDHTSFKLWGKNETDILYQCRYCGIVFFYPYPTQEKLDIFYSDQYHKKRGYDGSTSAGVLRRKMYDKDIDELQKYVLIHQGKFLDIGCAEGIYLSLLDNSWDKYGIDVSREAVEVAEQRGIKASTQDISEFEDVFFDVIHMRGVFEHILEPMPFLYKAYKKLKKGGYLVISNTPNISGIVPRIYREKFRLILPNEHVNYYSPETMRFLMNKIGLQIVKITYPYFGTPYCSFFKDMLKIVANKILGKESPPFWGNILSLYAKKI